MSERLDAGWYKTSGSSLAKMGQQSLPCSLGNHREDQWEGGKEKNR